MKIITIDVKDESYEEFMQLIEEYMDKCLIKVIGTKSSETPDNN